MFAQLPVGRWERNGAFLNIENNGSISASYDSNINRKWSSREGVTYNFIGPNSEQLILTLLENSEYFSLSNGQLWKRVANISDNASGWTNSGVSKTDELKGELNNPENSNFSKIIVGQWKHITKGGVMTFNADGTVLASWDSSILRYWKYLSPNTIKLWSNSGFDSDVVIYDNGTGMNVLVNGDQYEKIEGTSQSTNITSPANNSTSTTTVSKVNKTAIVGTWRHITKGGILYIQANGTATASWDNQKGRHWKHKRDDIFDFWGTNNGYSEVLMLKGGKELVFQLNGDHYEKID